MALRGLGRATDGDGSRPRFALGLMVRRFAGVGIGRGRQHLKAGSCSQEPCQVRSFRAGAAAGHIGSDALAEPHSPPQAAARQTL